VVIHWQPVRGPPVNNSTGKAAISAASTEEQRVTVLGLAVAMALAIAVVKGTEVEGQIAAEVRLESVLPVAVNLARATDLAAREIAAAEVAEIALVVATLEVGIGVASEMVPDTVAVVRVRVVVGVLPVWVVRVGASAELVAEVAAVEGGSELKRELWD